MVVEPLGVTLFDALTKREPDLPAQATDEELLAWAQEIQRDHTPRRGQLRAQPRRTRPLVAAAE